MVTGIVLMPCQHTSSAMQLQLHLPQRATVAQLQGQCTASRLSPQPQNPPRRRWTTRQSTDYLAGSADEGVLRLGPKTELDPKETRQVSGRSSRRCSALAGLCGKG